MLVPVKYVYGTTKLHEFEFLYILIWTGKKLCKVCFTTYYVSRVQDRVRLIKYILYLFLSCHHCVCCEEIEFRGYPIYTHVYITRSYTVPIYIPNYIGCDV